MPSLAIQITCSDRLSSNRFQIIREDRAGGVRSTMAKGGDANLTNAFYKHPRQKDNVCEDVGECINSFSDVIRHLYEKNASPLYYLVGECKDLEAKQCFISSNQIVPFSH